MLLRNIRSDGKIMKTFKQWKKRALEDLQKQMDEEVPTNSVGAGGINMKPTNIKLGTGIHKRNSRSK